MDNEQPSLFSFGIDETAHSHLISIAKWNRFMAIVGIVLCSLVILGLIFGGSIFASDLFRIGNQSSSLSSLPQGYWAGVIVFYILLACVFLVPCFFRLAFANKMLRALANSDQETLNQSLKHFKTYSAYWGVLTIIGIVFYVLFFVLLVFGIMASRARF